MATGTQYKVLPKSDEESPDDVHPSVNHHIDTKKFTESSIYQVLFGWFCMVLAVIAGASVGPVFKYMMAEGIGPLLSASWRNQTMVLALLPFACYEACSKSENRVEWLSVKPDLPFPIVVHVLISGISWSVNLLFWIVGLQYVSTFKASIVSSSHPVLLVLALRIKGHQVSAAEWLGVLIAFCGMFLSEYKASGEASNDIDEVPFHLQLFGYSLCFLAAAGEVVTILNRIKTRHYVPLLQYTVATSFIVVCNATILTLILEGSVLVDRSNAICWEEHCLLGWMSTKWRWKMYFFGLWVGAVCITGFNYAMQYIPPLVFSSVTLIDPAVTAFISWAAGIEHLPGLFSWLGGCVVVSGVVVISYGERRRSAREESAQLEAKVQEDNRHQYESQIHMPDSYDTSHHTTDLDDIEEGRAEKESVRAAMAVVEMRPLKVVHPYPHDAT